MVKNSRDALAQEFARISAEFTRHELAAAPRIRIPDPSSEIAQRELTKTKAELAAVLISNDELSQRLLTTQEEVRRTLVSMEQVEQKLRETRLNTASITKQKDELKQENEIVMQRVKSLTESLDRAQRDLESAKLQLKTSSQQGIAMHLTPPANELLTLLFSCCGARVSSLGSPLSVPSPFYRVEIGKGPFFVLAIFHDDKFTYIQAVPEKPFTVYESQDGKPMLINVNQRGGIYVVEKILDQGYLAIDGQKLEFKRQE